MLTTTKLSSFEEKLESRFSHFSSKHSFGMFLLLLMVSPIGLILAVTLFTTLLTLPLSLLFGWI